MRAKQKLTGTAMGMVATVAALMLALVAAHPVAAQAPIVPRRTAVPLADPCLRPALPTGVGGAAGEEIQQFTPEESSALLLELVGHTAPVHGVAYGAGGDLILTMAQDGVGLWDAYSGQQIAFFDGALAGAVSPDGAYRAVAFVEDGQVTLRIYAGDELLYTAPAPAMVAVHQMQFTPDGQLLALIQNSDVAIPNENGAFQKSEILLWDVAQGEVAQRLAGAHTAIPTSDPQATRWSDNATDGTLNVVVGGHSGYISDIAFSPDGRMLASASHDGTVRIWNLRTGVAQGCIEVSPGALDPVHTLGFSPDSRELGTVRSVYDEAASRRTYRFERWRVANARRLQETVFQTGDEQFIDPWAGNFYGGASALSPDLTRWLTPAGEAVLLWNLDSGALAGLVRQPDDASWADYAPDGATFATAYNYANDITGPIYGALLWDAAHADLAAGAKTEMFVLDAVQRLKEGKRAEAQRLLRRAAAINPFPWYDPGEDANARAGLAEPDDGSRRAVVRAGGRLNVRSQPQRGASLVTQLPDNAEIKVHARSPDGAWLYIAVIDKDGFPTLAWVAAQFVELDGSMQDLPVKPPS